MLNRWELTRERRVTYYLREDVAAEQEALLDTTRKALTAPRDDTSPPLLQAALAVGSVNDRVWVDVGALGLWTGTGTRALTLTPTTPKALRAVLSPR